jgi:hypothetical protein
MNSNLVLHGGRTGLPFPIPFSHLFFCRLDLTSPPRLCLLRFGVFV